MKIQLTASMAVLLLALIGPNGTLGVPIEQQAGKEDSKSIESNDVFWIPPPGAHYGPIAARGADESTFPPNFPMGGGGWEIVHHKRDGSTVLDTEENSLWMHSITVLHPTSQKSNTPQNEPQKTKRQIGVEDEFWFRSKQETGDEDASNLVSRDGITATDDDRHHVYTVETMITYDGILHLCPDNGECFTISPDASQKVKRLPGVQYESKREIGDQDPKPQSPEDFQNELYESERENKDKDDSNLESPEIFHIPSENADGKKIDKRAELVTEYKQPDEYDPYFKVHKRHKMQIEGWANSAYGAHIYGLGGGNTNFIGRGRQRFQGYKPLEGTLD